MTTPAINTDMRNNQPGRNYSVTNGVESPGTITSGLARYKVETRPASVNNPLDSSGWRRPSGWNHSIIDAVPAPTGAIVWVQDLRSPPATRNIDGSYYTGGGVFSSSMSALRTFDANLSNRAVIQALTKLKNSKVDLGVAFAERAQTARLFTESVTKIARSVSAFRSKNPKKIWDQIVGNEGKRGRSLPNSWLEVQYGWKPLMSDVSGAYNALREKDGNGRRYRMTVRGSAKGSYSIHWNKYSNSYGYTPVGGKEKHQAKVRLDYFLENPLLATLSQLGLTNPATLVWELYPYSFVADWFFPIGDAIGAMDAAVGWSFLGGTLTEYRELYEEGQGWAGAGPVPGNPNLVIHLQGFPVFNNRRMAMNRFVYSSSPLPRFPGYKNPLSTGHMANAMALLVSALSPHRRFSM
jgi:hypothetical protein